MPIYEYRCDACGHKLEALQRLADAPLLACPLCGKNALTKLVSAAGFQLKGSGWYATDFKGSGSKPADKPSGETAGDAKVGADGKTAATTPSGGESKAEAKGDAKPASTPAVTPASTPSTPATGSGNSSA